MLDDVQIDWIASRNVEHRTRGPELANALTSDERNPVGSQKDWSDGLLCDYERDERNIPHSPSIQTKHWINGRLNARSSQQLFIDIPLLAIRDRSSMASPKASGLPRHSKLNRSTLNSSHSRGNSEAISESNPPEVPNGHSIDNRQPERLCWTAEHRIVTKGSECCSAHKFPPDVAKKGRMPKRKQHLQERVFAVNHE
jgi:hypothetical protein